MNAVQMHDRPRRLADVGVPDARSEAVLRRHVLAADAATGMPGFDQMLRRVADAWQNRREQALEQADEMTERLAERRRRPRRSGASSSSSSCSSTRPSRSCAGLRPHLRRLRRGAKFPHPMDLRCCCASGSAPAAGTRSTWCTLTLDKMAGGGIYDQLGGGFARYRVDERWLVPHFEKMLYDNAPARARAISKRIWRPATPNYARVVRETLRLHPPRDDRPDGGFYSTRTPTAKAKKGKFYVWTPDEIEAVLGDEAGRDVLPCVRRDRRGQLRARPQHSSICRRRSSSAPRFGAATSRTELESWPQSRGRSCWRCATQRSAGAGRQGAGRAGTR